jgi:hypothetical protein
MENLALLPVMAFSKCEDNLQEYFPYDIFSNIVLLGFAFFDKLGHVSILAVFHDNVNLFGIFINNPIQSQSG